MSTAPSRCDGSWSVLTHSVQAARARRNVGHPCRSRPVALGEDAGKGFVGVKLQEAGQTPRPQRLGIPRTRAGGTYVVVDEIFDAPAVPAGKLHDVSLQPSLRGVAGDRLGPRGGGLVVSADPRRQALVGHFAGDISVYGGDELVVEMLLLAVVRGEEGVDAFREFGLVEAAWAPC